MNITWLGHSCFQIEEDGRSVVCDPYAPSYVPGLDDIQVMADAVVCSHEHGDHNYAQAVTLSGKGMPFVHTPLACWHDDTQGSQRGSNTISIFDLPSGLRAVHLGDLGHMPDEATLQAMAKPDVLMIPVGGFFTIDAVMAKAVCDALQPKVIVPMHYRSDRFGYDVIAPVESFTALYAADCVKGFEDSRLTVTADTAPMVAVLTPALVKG